MMAESSQTNIDIVVMEMKSRGPSRGWRRGPGDRGELGGGTLLLFTHSHSSLQLISARETKRPTDEQLQLQVQLQTICSGGGTVGSDGVEEGGGA